MELKYVPWNTVDLEDLNPLLQRQFVVGRDIMVARVLMKKGCIIPLHSHYNEQFTYILEGSLKFWVDGKVIAMNAGEVLTIPPHMPHKAEAMADISAFRMCFWRGILWKKIARQLTQPTPAADRAVVVHVFGGEAAQNVIEVERQSSPAST